MNDLIEILEDINPDIDYSNHDHLVDDEILTSFELVQLVTQINDTFDISIPAEEIIPENFNSAQAIYDLIQRIEEEG